MDRAERQAALALHALATDFRHARIAAALSLRDVARAVGISHTEVWRFERGLARSISIHRTYLLAAAVGLTPAVKLYPHGDPIRDAGQARLLTRFRSQLHPSLGWRTEVPLPDSRDPRAWDGMIFGERWRRAVEAETVIRDAQAQERRLALKMRDGAADQLVLLIADTTRNRAALAAAAAAFQAMPVRSREILSALRRGADPGRGILFL
jgi:transcriptional regulator with XRE-family HTH domain